MAVDMDMAFLVPAKLMAMTAIDLLWDGAKKAIEIKSSHPLKTSAEYEALWSEILAKK